MSALGGGLVKGVFLFLIRMTAGNDLCCGDFLVEVCKRSAVANFRGGRPIGAPDDRSRVFSSELQVRLTNEGVC